MDIPILTAEEGAVLLHAKNRELKAEIAWLQAALEEIAHHYIDSELASREKRGMAQRALTAAK
jgi:hypothetical protein